LFAYNKAGSPAAWRSSAPGVRADRDRPQARAGLRRRALRQRRRGAPVLTELRKLAAKRASAGDSQTATPVKSELDRLRERHARRLAGAQD